MARKIADTKKMTYEEWLELRKSSIGGSDAGAIIGENSYSSAITVYADKLGLSKPKEDNEAMRQGRDLEAYVADRFVEATGIKVRNDFFMYVDDEYDFLTANIDRRIVGENAGLECKTINSFHGYNLDAGEIPAHYYAQCQHYMMVMGWDYMWICFLVYGRSVNPLRIERNNKYIQDMRRAEVKFWQENVLKKIVPDPDGSEASIETLKEMYPKEGPNTEIRIPGLDHMVIEYNAAAEMEKHYKERKLELQGKICSKLGDNAVGIGTDYGVSWKSQSKASVSASKLKAKYPKIYEELVEVSEYRVFRKRNLNKGEK